MSETVNANVGSVQLPTPTSRVETLLNAIATANASGLPTPINRKEIYLYYIATHGVGGLLTAWDAETTYAKGSLVSYEGKMYEANTTPTVGTWVSSEWTEVDLNDVKAELEQKISDAVAGLWDNWSATVTYTAGQIVLYSGTPYQKKSGASTQGTFVPAEWERINISDELEKIALKQDKASAVSVVTLTDGTETLAQLSARIAAINLEGKHVFFDTSSLNQSMYLCTIFIDGTSKYRVTDAVTGKTSIGTYDASKTLSAILSEAIADLVTITVTCNTQDGVTVTGQTVTLRNGSSASAPVIATKAYNGQPVSFVVAKDTAYHISVSNTLAGHFNPTTATGSATTDTSVILTYGDVAHVTTFSDVRSALRSAGHSAAEALIGKEIVVDGISYVGVGTIANGRTGSIKLHDTSLTDGLIFQTKDCVASLQFDSAEAFYGATTSMSAGTYNFTILSAYSSWAAGTYQFTLANSLEAGSQLCISGNAGTALTSLFVNAYSDGASSTLLEQCAITSGSEGTSLGNWNGVACNHPQRIFYGNNNYKVSAIRQLLNSDKAAGLVWAPQHKWDRKPSWYDSAAGFLYGKSSALTDYIVEVEVDTYRNTVTDGGGLDTTTDKIFLAGRNEVFMTQEGADNGVAWEYYQQGSTLQVPHDAADAIRIKKYGANATYWWLRSPYVGDADYVRGVGTAGAGGNGGANSSYGTAPAFVIA